MTCRSRSTSAYAFCAALLAVVSPAMAADLPAVQASAANKVPECVTPGRLMAYVRERNPNLAPKYDGLAVAYMRNGEQLNLRWDYAFFQMLLETGYLTYTGDVKPEQNNFAGLGATGRGARGESFKDVATGARAHLEHLLMYSGAHVDNPTAERTRNVQDWGVLTSWQKQFTRPITFTDVAKQWAPTSRGYSSDIQTIAGRFFDGACNGSDPAPEQLAEARGGQDAGQDASATQKTPGAAIKAKAMAMGPKTKGQEAAERAVADAREEGAQRSTLGVTDEAGKQQAAAATEAAAKPSPKVTILNANPTPAGESAEAQAQAQGQAQASTEANRKADKPVDVAMVAGGVAGAQAKPDKVEKPEKKAKPAGQCRVWTASYGGAKAVIIKALAEKTVHYTVLDVNEGTEKREAEAYINAYAKGGEQVGEYASHSQALEKAFDLCPEG